MDADEPLVVTLARRQLDAYNRADFDGFCACYHEDVQVLDADGQVSIRGIAAFRERYRPKFVDGKFGATVSGRLQLGAHCIEHERYWVLGATGRTEGEVLVRYTEREGSLATVQFLR